MTPIRSEPRRAPRLVSYTLDSRLDSMLDSLSPLRLICCRPRTRNGFAGGFALCFMVRGGDRADDSDPQYGCGNGGTEKPVTPDP